MLSYTLSILYTTLSPAHSMLSHLPLTLCSQLYFYLPSSLMLPQTLASTLLVYQDFRIVSVSLSVDIP